MSEWTKRKVTSTVQPSDLMALTRASTRALGAIPGRGRGRGQLPPARAPAQCVWLRGWTDLVCGELVAWFPGAMEDMLGSPCGMV
jgi:hypothetical protein